jgi:hypothetical protein
MPSALTAGARPPLCLPLTIVTTVHVPTALAAYRWASADTWTAGTLLAALGLRG